MEAFPFVHGRTPAHIPRLLAPLGTIGSAMGPGSHADVRKMLRGKHGSQISKSSDVLNEKITLNILDQKIIRGKLVGNPT